MLLFLGTPVMFGGGVLAFTLLGLDFNEQTGETKVKYQIYSLRELIIINIF
jgi:hypothetical protein